MDRERERERERETEGETTKIQGRQTGRDREGQGQGKREIWICTSMGFKHRGTSATHEECQSSPVRLGRSLSSGGDPQRGPTGRQGGRTSGSARVRSASCWPKRAGGKFDPKGHAFPLDRWSSAVVHLTPPAGAAAAAAAADPQLSRRSSRPRPVAIPAV